jgi:hypothetical protein
VHFPLVLAVATAILCTARFSNHRGKGMGHETSSANTGETAKKPEPSVDARVIDIAVRLGILGLFAYFSLQLIAPFFLFLLWAVVLTVALYPAFDWLAEKLGGRKVPAAVLIRSCALRSSSVQSRFSLSVSQIPCKAGITPSPTVR